MIYELMKAAGYEPKAVQEEEADGSEFSREDDTVPLTECSLARTKEVAGAKKRMASGNTTPSECSVIFF